jgi:hypothetical protein
MHGEVSECHFCEAHAREAGVVLPRAVSRCWVDDDRHTRLAVTAGQIERPEDIAVRFPDGFEINLCDLWDLFTDGHQEMIRRSPDGAETRVRNWGELLDDRIPAVIDIPQEGAGEPRQVWLELAPETPKEGS